MVELAQENYRGEKQRLVDEAKRREDSIEPIIPRHWIRLQKILLPYENINCTCIYGPGNSSSSTGGDGGNCIEVPVFGYQRQPFTVFRLRKGHGEVL